MHPLINDCQAVIKAIEIRLEKPVSVFPAALNSWDPTTPTQLWLYKSSHAVFPAPSHLSSLRLSDRKSKQSLHTRSLCPNSALYAIALVSLGQVKFNRRKPSARTNTNADAIFICQAKWCICKCFPLICWVWRCKQTRECVCLLVGEGEGVGIENPYLDWP